MIRVAASFAFSFVTASAGAGVTSSARPAAHCDSARTVRVLFIGNSYTYVNNVPRLVEGISASLSGPCVESSMIAVGGMTLEGHWGADSAARRIRSGRWTAVVLQDQSTLGTAWLVDGRLRIGDSSAEFFEFGGRFVRTISAAKAKPVLLAHWAEDGAPRRDQQVLDYSFATLARASGSALAPVGEAITRMRTELPGISPTIDGGHLSVAGSYLEALVLYATLTDHSPVGAVQRIQGPPVEFLHGAVLRDSIITLADLPDSVATPLQRIAATVHAEQRGGIASVPKPPPLAAEFPKLPPNGEKMDVNQLMGRWRGSSTVLPTPARQPVAVELMLQPAQRTSMVGDSLHLQVGQIAFSGLATWRLQGDQLVATGAVTPQTRVGRTGPAAPFTIEIRAVMQAGKLSGIVIMHQPASESGPSTDAVGHVTLVHDTSGTSDLVRADESRDSLRENSQLELAVFANGHRLGARHVLSR